jgi:hypothetical protein
MPLLNRYTLPRYPAARPLYHHDDPQAVGGRVVAAGDEHLRRPAGAHCFKGRGRVALIRKNRIITALEVPYTRVRRGKDERWQGYNRECALSACDG